MKQEDEHAKQNNSQDPNNSENDVTPSEFQIRVVADGASELLQDVFGKRKNPSRLVYGVASLPLGTPVEVEWIFEVS